MTKTKVNNFIDRITKEYGYKPLPKDKSRLARAWYINNCPILDEEKDLYTESGMYLSSGFERIVVGDYGAFIEISPEQIALDNLEIQPGQEYRFEQWFKGKYHWYTCDLQISKIYHQLRGVSYADYKPGMYYISVYEVHQQ